MKLKQRSKTNKACLFPNGIDVDLERIPCTSIAKNQSSIEIVKDAERDSFFFRSLEKQGIQLNQKQIQAVRTIEGPVITLAGAGSGKTSVLTARVGYMLSVREIHPSNIMMLTFTRKAAEEMKERIEKIPGISLATVNKLITGTFHSVFLRVLRSQGINKKIISNERFKQITIKKILKQLKLDDGYEPESILAMIGYFKNHMLSPNDLPAKTPVDKEIKNIYALYEQWKTENNSIDFDDILVIMYEMLLSNFELREMLQNRVQYLLVDEFQDSSSIQYAILQILAAPHNNIMIVGDDWQSIYGFRGSDPSIILQFPHDYSNCQKVILDTNYRSNPFIVGLGNSIIKHNTKQFNKTLLTHKIEGAKPKYFRPNDSEEEADMIINDVLSQIESGEKQYRDFAVLYRTHAVSRAITDQLVLRDIPFVQYNNKNLFYDNSYVKPVLDVLRLAIRPKSDFEALKGVCPLLYISKDKIMDGVLNSYAIDDIEGETKPLLSYLLKDTLTYQQKERVLLALHTLKECRTKKPAEAIQHIRNGHLQYEQFIKDNRRKTISIHKEMITEALDELESSASSFQTVKDYMLFVEKLQAQYEDMKNLQSQEDKNAISLMSIHGSKGLEFNHVYLIGACEGTIPHKSSLEIMDDRIMENGKSKNEILQELLEEERRLLYVAVTRAKEYLHILSPKMIRGKEVEISHFLHEVFLEKSNKK